MDILGNARYNEVSTKKHFRRKCKIEKSIAKKALTAYEDTNMNGGSHRTNYDVAKKAIDEGRDLIVHWSHYDGQRYHEGKYRVTDLRVEGENIVGTADDGSRWEATRTLCDYAQTGRI